MAVASNLPRLGPRLSCSLSATPLCQRLYSAAAGKDGGSRDGGKRAGAKKPAASQDTGVAAREGGRGRQAQQRGGRQSGGPGKKRRAKADGGDQGAAPKVTGGGNRYIADAARKFMSGGTMRTTRENVDFFIEHDIEPDNGRMRPFTSQPQMREIAREYRLRLSYSPRHMLNPYHMEYFDPLGHPRAELLRSQYARKKVEQPLWLIFTAKATGVSAVVRGLTQRRLAGALHSSLAELGYTLGAGLGAHKVIRGTLWVSMMDPIVTANKSADGFGREVAAALDKECSYRI